MGKHIFKSDLNLKAEVFSKGSIITGVKLSLNDAPEFCLQVEGPFENRVFDWIEQYLDKKNPAVELPLDWNSLSGYSKTILKELSSLPFGVSLSYKQLATLSGNERAARAVGNACGKNPFPLLVPCHRVLKSCGGLGGFSAGIEIKKKLIKFEEK